MNKSLSVIKQLQILSDERLKRLYYIAQISQFIKNMEEADLFLTEKQKRIRDEVIIELLS